MFSQQNSFTCAIQPHNISSIIEPLNLTPVAVHGSPMRELHDFGVAVTPKLQHQTISGKRKSVRLNEKIKNAIPLDIFRKINGRRLTIYPIDLRDQRWL